MIATIMIIHDSYDDIQIGDIFLNSYGGIDKFYGKIQTAKCEHSNSVVKENTNTYDIETLLNKNISKLNLGAVVDVTDQFVRINLKGDKIYDLFRTGSPFNFNDFKDKIGSVTQTILAKIDVIIHNQNKNEVNLFVRRSFSEHLFSWMNDSASRL